MARGVPVKSKAELEQMHTGTLMNRRDALLRCPESPGGSHPHSADLIAFKDSPEWKRAYDELRAVLSTREHLPNKQERKAIRQQKARQK